MNLILRHLTLPLLLAAALPGQHYIRGTLGVYVNGHYGSTIAVGGDYTDDGVPDYLIGTPNRGTGTLANVGQVTIVSGATGAASVGASGAVAGRRLGTAIAALDDVNGDGAPDFASSSPHDSTNGANAGYLGCYSGVTGALLWQVVGTIPGQWFGQSIVGVPDINGDGRMDIAVGAPRQTGSTPAGRVYVYSGATGTLLAILGGVGTDQFGSSLALVGDQDGDQIPDLAIGSPGLGSSVKVYHLSNVPSLIWSRSGPNGFGVALANAGDVDGDGRDDILVGQAEILGMGSVYILSGATTQVLRQRTGGINELYGTALAGGRDINADGYSDYVIGAPGAGGGAGRIEVRSGLNGSLLFSWNGATDENLGAAVGMLPDLNGDNLPEVAFGRPGWDNGTTLNVGRVDVRGYDLSGNATFLGLGCSGPVADPSVAIYQTQAHFGGSLAATAINLRPSSLGLWLIGFTPLPQPIDLAPIGMPGCILRVGIEVTQTFVTDAFGNTTLTVAIPNNPAMTGLRLQVQGAGHDPGANLLDLIVTNAWQFQVGNS